MCPIPKYVGRSEGKASIVPFQPVGSHVSSPILKNIQENVDLTYADQYNIVKVMVMTLGVEGQPAGQEQSQKNTKIPL